MSLGQIKANLNSVRIYKHAFKNYIHVLYEIRYRTNKNVKVILKDGRKFLVSRYFVSAYAAIKFSNNPDISEVNIIKNKLTFVYKGNQLSFDVKGGGDFAGCFLSEDYKFLNVKDEVVIDVGMNIGDSSIYFALNGATKVIGLEPYLYPFTFAKKNIEECNLAAKIEFLNAGYGKDGEIIVDENRITDGGTNLVGSETGKKVRIFSLKTLVSEYNIVEAVLKMDCEGCEYNLLDEGSNVLRKFKRIQIEYHYGYEKLVNKLRDCNFDVEFTLPKKSYVKSYVALNSNPDVNIGYIYAVRQ